MKALVLTPKTRSTEVRDIPTPAPVSCITSKTAECKMERGLRVSSKEVSSSSDDGSGAFAEYVAAPYDLLWTVPESLSFEEASTVSMCGLFDRFGLPSPFSTGSTTTSDDPINVLVYGSSTCLGLLAAQLVHRVSENSGRRLRLIGVASSSKHEFPRAAP
ncbi:hypothetical protein J3459_018067 [Metarhizium acridum]|uniref:uncharacterized protein n=1 Tax=Metarhizium acridum TaxID=92637 RepID=UPI001C6BF3E1|nr:hypothetical protein J3459_018067 [Metarhizium acridum]KAG8410296.1 hypothetical protein J3458_018008 [Metarhizium acridum]